MINNRLAHAARQSVTPVLCAATAPADSRPKLNPRNRQPLFKGETPDGSSRLNSELQSEQILQPRPRFADNAGARQPAQTVVHEFDDNDEHIERRHRSAQASTSSSSDVSQAWRSPKQPAARKQRPQIPVVREKDTDKGTFFSGDSFKHVGASQDIIAALKTLGISRPSHVQAQSYNAFFNTDSQAVVLADQAGSGKTLAYLLPLVQAMRAEEQAAGQPVTVPNSPRAVIVAPTVELVQQVCRVARALSQAGVPFKSAAMTGGQKTDQERAKSFRTQKDMLKAGVDLVVATPGRLLEHVSRGNLDLSCCRALVLDEVDVLLGDASSFQQQVLPLKEAAPASMRFVLVTATLPQHVFQQIRAIFPDAATAFGPGLHRTAAGITEEVIDCSGGDEVSLESGMKRKLEALEKSLDRHAAERCIVFCNKIEACRDVENHLKRHDRNQQKYRVLPYHEAIRDDLRQDALDTFLAKQQPGELPTILVCTDRTSRGIDSMYCEHVVLFDFPRDPSEYVRRVGRTARGAGGRGVVSVLVLGRQVAMANDVIGRNQKGMPVHSIPK